MQVVEIRAPGGPEQLQAAAAEPPVPGDEDVLIDVYAAGVNRPDCLQRAGLYPVPPGASPLPGLEVAGRVVEVGQKVAGVNPGDAVCALVHGGGYAQRCLAHEGQVLPKPAGYTWQQAAALPETLFTVYYNVVERAALAAKEILLVHGGASGIGTMATQVGKALGATVITTAGTDEKCRFSETVGADLAINYRETSFAEVVAKRYGGVDVVLDMVAGNYVQPNLDLLNRDGRYVLIAFLGGAKADLNLGPILRKRLTLTGSTLRPQSNAEKRAIRDGIRRHLWEAVAAGIIKPPIFAEFALEDAASAHTLMESNANCGKIVLTTKALPA